MAHNQTFLKVLNVDTSRVKKQFRPLQVNTGSKRIHKKKSYLLFKPLSNEPPMNLKSHEGEGLTELTQAKTTQVLYIQDELH